MLEPELTGARGAARLQHFRLLAAQIDPAPILDEIASLENPWDRSTGRQKKIQVQREARSIPIRGLRKSAIGNLERRDVHEPATPPPHACCQRQSCFLKIGRCA